MKKALPIFLIACISNFIIVQSVILPRKNINPGITFSKKIIGGNISLITNHPWQAFISTNETYFSGAIIGSSYIITAAHCLYDSEGHVNPSKFTVKVGTSQPFADSLGTAYKVSNAYVHPSYDPSTGLNDIAILKLTTPIGFDGVDVITLASAPDGIGIGTTTNVAGWGCIDAFTLAIPEFLHEINIPIAELYTSYIVAGYSNGSQAVCYGDGGAPLVADIGGTKKLVGITSSNTGNNCDSYGIFTRVSHYTTWISEIIENFNPYGDTIVCESDSVSNYTCNNIGGYSYQWQLSPAEAGTLVPNRYTCSIKWGPDFKDTVILSVKGGTSVWYPITINRLSTTSFITFPEGMSLREHADTILLARAVGHNVTYQWMKDNVVIEGETDSTLTLSNVGSSDEGSYKVLASGTCSSVESDTFNIRISSVSTSIYNKPILSRFINMEVSPTEIFSVYVYNLDGKLVYQKSNITAEQGDDFSFLRKGVYIVQIQLGKGHPKTMKFICY
jgi:hypothetical protein